MAGKGYEACAEKVTKAIEDSLGPLKQPVWVILSEVPLSDWGVGGKPVRPPENQRR